MTKKRGLGKGIGALIPDVDTGFTDDREMIRQIAVENIRANPYQPRKQIAEEKIQELSASIQEKGILQPLLVKKDGPDYILIAGERRLVAARRAGFGTVPAVVREADEQQMQELALIENIQREDLNVVEEAQAYESLIERFGYTQEDLSRRVGKSRTAVTNSLRLLKLADTIKQDLLDGKITMGHARAYLGVDGAHQREVHRTVIKKSLSVRQTENLIKKLKSGQKSPEKQNRKSDESVQFRYMREELQKKFSTRVDIRQQGKKGKIVIEYYSPEEFERIYDLLRS